MGKINLDSIKLCLETANDSFKEMEGERVSDNICAYEKEQESVDSLLDNVHDMMKNIPTFSQDKD